MFFCLCWVFVAPSGLSLVAANGATLSLQCEASIVVTSLGAERRLYSALPMHGVGVQSLVKELDPHAATKDPACHS